MAGLRLPLLQPLRVTYCWGLSAGARPKCLVPSFLSAVECWTANPNPQPASLVSHAVDDLAYAYTFTINRIQADGTADADKTVTVYQDERVLQQSEFVLPIGTDSLDGPGRCVAGAWAAAVDVAPGCKKWVAAASHNALIDNRQSMSVHDN